MATIDLKYSSQQVLAGDDGVVIRKYLDGVEGGRALDLTGYLGGDIIGAGHVIITDGKGGYKPMPVSASTGDTKGTYQALPEGWSYCGILVATIDGKREGAAIMTRGKVNKNDNVMPYSVTGILDALKAALPNIEFTEDE